MHARGFGPGGAAYQAGVSYNYIYKISQGWCSAHCSKPGRQSSDRIATNSGYLLGLTDDPTPDIPPGGGLVIGEDRPVYTPLACECPGPGGAAHALPAGVRAQAVEVFDGMLELIEAEQDAGLSARQWKILDDFDGLKVEADQELALAQAEARTTCSRLRAHRRATNASSVSSSQIELGERHGEFPAFLASHGGPRGAKTERVFEYSPNPKECQRHGDGKE